VRHCHLGQAIRPKTDEQQTYNRPHKKHYSKQQKKKGIPPTSHSRCAMQGQTTTSLPPTLNSHCVRQEHSRRQLLENMNDHVMCIKSNCTMSRQIGMSKRNTLHFHRKNSNLRSINLNTGEYEKMSP
jgi:hypothetical protein